jgi:hypothetical protein
MLKEMAKATKGEFTFDLPDAMGAPKAASADDGGAGKKGGKKKN